jgi:flagellar hook-basal body complex protein FliE
MKDKSSIKTIEEKLHFINDQIDFFQNTLEKLPRKFGDKVSNAVDDLNQKKDHFENKFESFKRTGVNAYQDVEIGVQMAWDDLNTAYDSAKERFKNELL